MCRIHISISSHMIITCTSQTSWYFYLCAKFLMKLIKDLGKLMMLITNFKTMLLSRTFCLAGKFWAECFGHAYLGICNVFTCIFVSYRLSVSQQKQELHNVGFLQGGQWSGWCSQSSVLMARPQLSG